MITTIIIDDESNAVKTLRELIKLNCPEVKVIGEARDIRTGLALIYQKKPSVVLLDIQMNEGTGFDLLDLIPEIEFHVIFTTAYAEFALKAFKYQTIDYLLKPIDPDELKAAFEKVRKNTRLYNFPTAPARASEASVQNPRDQIALTTSEGVSILKLDHIVRLESSGSYTTFHTTDKKRIVVTKTLKEFEVVLPSSDFIRIHQSHIVNLHFVKMVLKEDGGQILLRNDEKVPISRRKKESIMDALYGRSLS